LPQDYSSPTMCVHLSNAPMSSILEAVVSMVISHYFDHTFECTI